MPVLVTRDTGGTSKPLDAVYVPAEAQVAPVSDKQLAEAGLDVAVLFDLLSACAAHERCGTHLYRSVAARTNSAELREKYEHFGAETLEHVELLEELISSAGGDPSYVSPAARATEHSAGALLESTFLLGGSVDEVTAEAVMLEAVMLAEAKDHANWQFLSELTTMLPAKGKLRKAFEQTTERVLEQEVEHYGWAREALAALRTAAISPPSGNDRKKSR